MVGSDLTFDGKCALVVSVGKGRLVIKDKDGMAVVREKISLRDAEDLYDDMLDEETVTVFGIEFSGSRILKNCDPVCYRIGFTDYCDDLESMGYEVVGWSE